MAHRCASLSALYSTTRPGYQPPYCTHRQHFSVPVGQHSPKHCGKPADRAEGTDGNAGLAWGRQVLRTGMRSEKWRSCSSKIWLRCHSQAGVARTQLLHEALACLHNSSGTAAACQWGCDSKVMLPLSDAPKVVHTCGDPNHCQNETLAQPVHGAGSKMSVCFPTAVQTPNSSAHRWPVSRDRLPHKLVNLGCPLTGPLPLNCGCSFPLHPAPLLRPLLSKCSFRGLLLNRGRKCQAEGPSQVDAKSDPCACGACQAAIVDSA